MDKSTTGFLSLPRELRDQVYQQWWSASEYRYKDDDAIWIPFEDPNQPGQPFRVSGWRINRLIDKDHLHMLLLNHQISSELLSSAFKDLHLTISIEHLAINETLAPWTLSSWGIPPGPLAHARHLDVRVALVPRWAFAARHTIEAQKRALRERGHNSYMGEPRNSAHRAALSMRRAQVVGGRHVEWTTPPSAFEAFAAAMEPLGAAVAERGLAMPDRCRDDFDSDTHLQRYLFWELIGVGRQTAIMNRFWQRIEAIKKVWNVELPWGNYLAWFKRDVYGQDAEMAATLKRILWEDFVAGIRRLREELTELAEKAVNLETLRVHLRVEDEAIAGVKCALWELLEEEPSLMELRNLESISLFSKGEALNGEYITNIEQWTSQHHPNRYGGLREAIGKSGAEQPVQIKIKSSGLVRELRSRSDDIEV